MQCDVELYTANIPNVVVEWVTRLEETSLVNILCLFEYSLSRDLTSMPLDNFSVPRTQVTHEVKRFDEKVTLRSKRFVSV